MRGVRVVEPMITLPRGLVRALGARTKSVSHHQLKAAGKAAYDSPTSHTYDSAGAATAFAAFRAPAVYAATSRVLSEAVHAASSLGWDLGAELGSTLDVGSGTCASTWGVNAVLPSALTSALTLIEPSPAMAACGMDILPDDPDLLDVLSSRVALSSSTQPHDLVLASYALCDTPETPLVDATLASMWDATAKIMVVIEPGTPKGFANILRARDVVRAAGNGVIMAPCMHAGPCPMAGNLERILSPKKDKEEEEEEEEEGVDSRYLRSWCHFPQLYVRTPFQRAAKRASTSYSREKFSFLVVAKADALPSGAGAERARSAKIVSAPLKRGKHVIMDLCTDEGGLDRVVVTKGKSPTRAMYRSIRKAKWGDNVEVPGANGGASGGGGGGGGGGVDVDADAAER